MRDEQKTKAQLLRELESLRAELEPHRQREREESATWKQAVFADNPFVRVLDEALPHGLAYVDMDLCFGFVSRGLEEFLGASRKEMMGKPMASLLGKDVFDKIKLHIFQVLTGRQGVSCELALDLPDSETKLCRILLQPCRPQGVEGAVDGFFAIFTDDSRESSAQQAVRDSQMNAQALLDAVPEASFLMEADGGLLACNTAAAMGLDMAPSKIFGRNLYDLLPSHEADLTREMVAEVGRGKRAVRFLNLFEERIFDHSLCPILNDEGEVARLAVFQRDITDRKRSEEALKDALHSTEREVEKRTVELREANESLRREVEERKRAEENLRTSKELLEKTFTGLRDAVFIVDAVTVKILDCNPAATEIFGYGREEVIGKLTDQLHTSPKSLDQFRGYLEYAVEKVGYLQLDDFAMRRKSGELFPTEHTVTPLVDEQGHRFAWVSIVRDITPRKETEETLATRLRYEMALADCSKALLSGEEARKAFHGALGTLRQAVKADRVYIFENFDCAEHGLCCRQIFEVCADEVAPQIENPDLLHAPYSQGMEWLQAELSKNCPVFGEVESFPEPMRTVLKEQEILSILVLPIFIGRSWYGFIGFDDTACTRGWKREDVLLLTTAAEMFGAAFHRYASEQALRESQERLTGIIESVPDMMVILDEDFRVAWANDVARDFFGAEMAAEPFFAHGVGAGMEAAKAGVRACFQDGEVHEMEVEFLGCGGGRMDALCSTAVAARHLDGRPKWAITVCRDITGKKRLQAEAMRAGHLASLGELAAGVAHEINNPITGIINYAQMLVDSREKVVSGLDIPGRIIQEGERIAEIVRNLLFFARGRKQERTLVDIREVLNNTLDLTRAQLEKNGIVLRLDLPGHLPMVPGRSREIQQVFLNILSNARYALNARDADGFPEKLLGVRAEETVGENGPGVRLVFRDQGIGMSPAVLGRVCEPFFSTKPEGEGTGLGLSISYGIVKDHGGSLSFESREGECTAVTVEFPGGEVGKP
jgi:PAS domain S-box-containing protein